ncbi:MAG: hypothetical protein K0S21_2300, partial [Rhizobiaceae bacterium]|nr:hypothetical protein [Rhizobiaceae bacterium]
MIGTGLAAAGHRAAVVAVGGNIAGRLAARGALRRAMRGV